MTEPQPAANICEHHYASRVLGGHPLYVRACTLCHTPDWADLGQQATDLLAPLENRLRLAHQARRAKEHQLDDIRRALCDIGVIEDDDPYSHADLADVIRQTGPALDEHGPAETEATEHVYLSTGCFHGDHSYCKSMTGLNGAKRPGECKHCGARCICACHTAPGPA